MPTTYSRDLLSGSTNGRPIGVDAVTSPGTTIHTVQATSTAAREEVHLYAVNIDGATATHLLTIEFGSTEVSDGIPINMLGGDGPIPVSPGLSLSATTSIVRAFATATGLFTIAGWINRAT